MQTGRKIVLGSAIAAALATSAIVAGVAFAAPSTTTGSSTTTVGVSKSAEAVDAVEANGAETTEVKGAETHGINHQFSGEEVGNNGDGVPDANEAAETK